MLIEFRFENVRSFRDEQVLSMVASADKSLPHNTSCLGKTRLLRSAAVFGANASGKTNVLQALNFMRGGVIRSADIEPGKEIAVVPFRLEASSVKRPSSFEMTFSHEGLRYQYGFSVSRDAVHREWLIAFPHGRAQRWFERVYMPSRSESRWKFGSQLKGQRSQLKELTRPNALFLSVAAKFNHKQLTPVFRWFREELGFVNLGEPPGATVGFTAERSFEDSRFRRRVTKLVHDADFGIREVSVAKRTVTKDRIERYFARMLGERAPDSAGSLEVQEVAVFEVSTLHKAAGAEDPVRFRLEDESAGTQRFFALAGPWLEALEKGQILVVDELEASMHSLLTRRLVKAFQNPRVNKKGAQLIFATHDTTLMDPTLLRRDQVWLTEKDRAGASHLYSLADYRKGKPRKGEALQKGYLAGRYGALPRLGGFGI